MTEDRTLLGARDLVELQSRLLHTPDPEIGDELVRLDPVDQALLFRLLPKDRAIHVFETLDPADQADLLAALRTDEVASIVEELDPDDRAHLLDEMPAKVATLLLNGISREERERTAALLGYAEDSAGRMMTPEYVSVRSDLRAGQAIDRVRTAGVDAETIYVLYVVDEGRRLVGVVSLKDVVLAEPGTPIARFMTTDVVSARTEEDQEEVSRRLVDNELLALPVLDREGRLVGIITVDDAIWILQREATEDVERIGGAQPLERPYLGAGVFRIYRARIGWLLMLFLAATLTGSILRAFEDNLQSVTALAFFIPLLIGTGGNAGAQTATTIVRAMAIGEIRFGDVARVVFKELRIGLLLGASMAVVGIVRAATWGTGARLSLVVGLGLVAVVLLATFVAGILPIVLKRLRLDPAVVSAPFITTFVDATGLLIYFLLARALLPV